MGTAGVLVRTGTGPDVATSGVAVGSAVIVEAGGTVADVDDTGDGAASCAEGPAEGEGPGGDGAGPHPRSETIPISAATARLGTARRCGSRDDVRTMAP